MLNLKKLAVLTLPTFLRKPLLAGMAQAMVSPLETLQRAVESHRTETLDGLARNGQVCRLRGLLNDLFDPDSRGIWIADAAESGEGAQDGILWLRSEERPLHVPMRKDGRLALGRRGLGGMTGTDFEVHLPYWLGMRRDYERLAAQVAAVTRAHRLAGKRFVVVGHRINPIRPL